MPVACVGVADEYGVEAPSVASLVLFTTVIATAAPMAAPPLPAPEVATALASALETPSTLAAVAIVRPPVALTPTLVGT